MGLVECAAFRLFRPAAGGGSRLAPLIATLGISFILYQGALIWRYFLPNWIPGEHRSVPGAILAAIVVGGYDLVAIPLLGAFLAQFRTADLRFGSAFRPARAELLQLRPGPLPDDPGARAGVTLAAAHPSDAGFIQNASPRVNGGARLEP